VIGEDNSIHLPPPGGRIIGTFQGNQKGFGFVSPFDPSSTEDLYIPAQETLDAMTGDVVEATVRRRQVRGQMRSYGEITRIITRGKDKFVGTLMRAANRWMVQTDGRVIHQPIAVDDVGAKEARPGDRVVVRLTEFPQQEQLARGVVIEVLGAEGEYEAELGAVIREFDLPEAFPAEVDNDLDRVIERFNRQVLPELTKGKLPAGRQDLRDELTFTIDPVDARDFDDAISIRATRDGFELGVHIADVSYFVETEGPIDREAAERGNSVYLPRKVIPMIPEALSNGLCSLQQDQDRMTKSVFIAYDRKGQVKGTRFANSVIRSKQRLTYDQATGVLDGKTDGIAPAVVAAIKQAEDLAKRILQRRRAEGMLHLMLPEVELVYNDKGEVVDAHPADDSFSHTIIEMFMVEANEAVARLLDSCNVPFLQRIHPEPEQAAFEQLSKFLTLFGLKLPKQPDRSDLQRLIQTSAGKPSSFAVNIAILRSLQKAEYSTKNPGHFALASSHYCHFTSPIRRYPDLTVHRLLDEHFAGRLKKNARKLRDHAYALEEIGSRCNFTERQAESAERQLTETLVLQLLAQQIGRHYQGVVSGVSALGAFVQLSKFLADGLLKVEELGSDWWELNVEGGYIQGRRSKRRIAIGDPIEVKIVAADPLRRRLDLAPVDEKLLARAERSPRRPERGERAKPAKERGKSKSGARRGKRRR